jgi:ApaG protein
MSNAITQGIRVTVQVQYLAERSTPAARQYVFAYTVRIKNEGTRQAQLLSRHWVITDSEGKVQEVKGAGVVGHQPTLKPGEEFEYTSWCPLPTPQGTMQGTYQMVREDGSAFDAEIAPFSLLVPHTLN